MIKLDPRPFFYEVANKIGNHLARLATRLDYEIYNYEINGDSCSSFEKAIKFLTRWYQKYVDQATINKLINTLVEIKRKDIAKEICE